MMQKPSVMCDWSIAAFQAMNQQTYGVQNDRNFEAIQMI